MAFSANRFTRQTLAFNAGAVTLTDASIVDGPALFSYASAADAIATIEGANYFADVVYDLAVGDVIIANGSDASNMMIIATVDRSAGTVTVNSFTASGSVGTANIQNGAVTGVKLANPLVGSGSGFAFTDTTASATPSTIRALKGVMGSTNTTVTSGNLVGVRGEVDMVGASGGFFYGAQGKVIPTGTLSGSSWTAGLFGQFDISAATVNAGQMACIWGDYGATSGTMTDASGCRGIAMTNTTAAVLNAQDYRYGNATYLLELAGAGGTLNYYAAAGTSAGSAGDAAHCAAQMVIKVVINGTAAYIPVFTQNT